MAANAIDLTTLAAVKAYAPFVGTTLDVLLQSLITAASSSFLTLTRRGNAFIAAQTAAERRDGTGTDSMLVHNFPVKTYSSLIIAGQTIPASVTTTDSGWVCDLASGYVTLRGYVYCRGRGNVIHNYTYGYDAIPYDVMQAVNEMVVFLLTLRNHLDKNTETLAAQVTSYKKDYPQSVLECISYYETKRRRP